MLLYLIFSYYETLDAFEMYYVGKSKTEALDKFKIATDFVFDATLKTGRLYFICFDTAKEPGARFKDKVHIADYKLEDISFAIKNLTRAEGSSCLYTHVPFATNTKLKSRAVCCDACAKSATAVYKSAYGNLYCAECWDTYVHPMGSISNTVDRADGLVEYVIGIANGSYSVNTFTDEERGYIAAVWQTKKADLLLSAEEIESIERLCTLKGFKLTKD
jgi:ribosomal protein S27E